LRAIVRWMVSCSKAAGGLFKTSTGRLHPWDLYPAYPTFVDGRTDVFTAQIFDDYIGLWNARGDWRSRLDHYGINLVFLPPQSPLIGALGQAGWAEVHRDESSVILQRPGAAAEPTG
jgi:hypothetical protein